MSSSSSLSGTPPSRPPRIATNTAINIGISVIGGDITPSPAPRQGNPVTPTPTNRHNHTYEADSPSSQHADSYMDEDFPDIDTLTNRQAPPVDTDMGNNTPSNAQPRRPANDFSDDGRQPDPSADLIHTPSRDLNLILSADDDIFADSRDDQNRPPSGTGPGDTIQPSQDDGDIAMLDLLHYPGHNGPTLNIPRRPAPPNTDPPYRGTPGDASTARPPVSSGTYQSRLLGNPQRLLAMTSDADANHQAALRIALILEFGIIPCHPDDHARMDQSHQHHQCSSISVTYAESNPSATSTADRQGLIGLCRVRDLKQTDRADLPSAPSFAERFIGTPPSVAQQDPPVVSNVCVAEDHYTEIAFDEPTFDIDSSIQFSTSLLFLKNTFVYIPTPQPMQMLDKSIHIKIPILEPNETLPSQVPLWRVPHCLFGRAHDKQRIYMFFPDRYNKYTCKNQAEKLNNEDFRILYENVMYPSLASALGSQRTTLLSAVPIFEAVKMVSTVQTEVTGNRAHRGAPYEIPVEISFVQGLWREMRARLGHSSTKAQLGGGIFFLHDGLNTKSNYMGATVDAAHSRFRLYQRQLEPTEDQLAADALEAEAVVATGTPVQFPDNNLDGPASPRPSHLQTPGANENEDEFTSAAQAIHELQEHGEFIDVAASHIARSNGSRGQALATLARTCCTRNTTDFLIGQMDRALRPHDELQLEQYPPPSLQLHKYNANATTYNTHNLRDVAGATLEPPRSSELFKAGLLYYQSYAQTNEILNTRHNPFQHEDIPDIVLSDDAFMTVRAAAGSGGGKAAGGKAAAETACDQSRTRVNALCNPQHSEGQHHISTGHRVEFRVRKDLAILVGHYQSILATEEGTSPHRRSHTCATGFFVIPKKTLMNYIGGNVHKCLSLMDSIRCLHFDNGGRFIPSAAIDLFRIVALFLRNFISEINKRVNIRLSSFLNNPTSPEPGSSKTPGLDLKQSMQDHGYPFLPDVIDWQELQLREEHSHLVPPTFGRFKNWKAAQQAELGLMFATDLLSKCLDMPFLTGTQADHVFECLVKSLLSSYQAHTIEKVAGKRPNPLKSAFLQAPVKWTWGGITSIYESVGESCVPTTSASSRFQHSAPFFNWTWTSLPKPGGLPGKSGLPGSKWVRTNIELLPFRKTALLIQEMLQQAGHRILKCDRFLTILYYRFFWQQTCFPYPEVNTGSLSTTNKTDKQKPAFRQWVCFRWQLGCPGDVIKPDAHYLDKIAVLNKEPKTSGESLPSPYSSAYETSSVSAIIDSLVDVIA